VGGWSQGVIPYIKYKLRPVLLGGTPRNYHLFLLSASGTIAREVASLVERGLIKKAIIDSEFPMEQTVEVCGLPCSRFAVNRANAWQAFEKLATGRAKGKVVVNVNSC